MRKLLLNALFASLAAVSALTQAGLKITPIQLYIGDKSNQRSATVTLDYTEVSAARIFEATAVRWSQNEKGEDVYTPDPDVLINPKNFVLQPDSRQLVRVGFSQPVGAMNLKEEGAWRVLFNEIPPVEQENSVSFLFTISLPLFIGAQNQADLRPSVKYRANSLILTLANNANSHIQIKEISLVDSRGNAVASFPEMKYLLANQRGEFDLGQVKLASAEAYKVIIKTDKGEAPLEIAL